MRSIGAVLLAWLVSDKSHAFMKVRCQRIGGATQVAMGFLVAFGFPNMDANSIAARAPTLCSCLSQQQLQELRLGRLLICIIAKLPLLEF